MADFVTVTYGQTGASQSVNALGMRAMQARAFDARNSQYLLVKAPPASGKSRALMFIGLDKLENQGLSKVIVAVPERSIGNSFKSTKLTETGFFRDWIVDPKWNLTDSAGAAGKVSAFKAFMASDDEILVCTHATLRFAFDQLGELPVIVMAVAGAHFQFDAGILRHDKRVRRRLDNLGGARGRVQIYDDACIGYEPNARISEEA